MQISGTAVCVGDNVNTDVMYPGRYLAVRDPREQAVHLFEALGSDLRQRLAVSGILVGGWNLGSGSSREHAVTALLGNDVRLVIAKSFGRIFFRNAVNNGLPVVVAPELADDLHDGDSVSVDLASGAARSTRRDFRFQPLPLKLLVILSGGGLWATLASKQD